MPSPVDVVAVADAYTFVQPGALFNSWPHMEWTAFCAERFGFETTIENVPGSRATLNAQVSREQLDRWVEVDSACTAEAVRRGWVIGQPSSPEEFRAEYQRLLRVNACLTDLGYGTDPPSEDAFVEGAEWNIYANTPMGSEVGIMPGTQDSLPPIVRQQLEIQAECWGA